MALPASKKEQCLEMPSSEATTANDEIQKLRQELQEKTRLITMLQEEASKREEHVDRLEAQVADLRREMDAMRANERAVQLVAYVSTPEARPRYDLALQLIVDHPEEALSDIMWAAREQQSTLFHVLVNKYGRAPNQDYLALIRAIVREKPQLVAAADADGLTPMHLCLRIQPNHIMALDFIRACPEAVNGVSRDWRRTPFHIGCSTDADINILREMLHVNPALASQQQRCGWYAFGVARDVTPAQLLWEENEAAMDKMALVVLTAFEGRVVDPLPMENLLYAACCYYCPQKYFQSVLRDNANQAEQRDNRGNLPLHYAVKALFAAGWEGINGEVAQRAIQAYFHFIIQKLLEVYPDAARMPDSDGRLPLFVALMNHSISFNKTVILDLVRAYPEALQMSDADTGLTPLLMTATRADESNLHLSVTYELLLKTPDVLVHTLQDY